MSYLRLGGNLSVTAPGLEGRAAAPVDFDGALQVPRLRIALCGS
jgi:hypothetical protein